MVARGDYSGLSMVRNDGFKDQTPLNMCISCICVYIYIYTSICCTYTDLYLVRDDSYKMD